MKRKTKQEDEAMKVLFDIVNEETQAVKDIFDRYTLTKGYNLPDTWDMLHWKPVTAARIRNLFNLLELSIATKKLMDELFDKFMELQRPKSNERAPHE